ncbi:MAG: hypothetical protein DRJ18_01690 [Candidatus Methanomethylicota archaeon]|nr:hypothetical protein [Candidatus Culexmicrobium cathedralense]RLE48592.1 MAG: hypothetical protein DRJ18_01690 [Candidatus Verstraetearchaeota archaeon]
MSLHLTVSEKIYPKLADKKDEFLKKFAEEMARRGFKTKTSRESGFDLIYSDFFGEAKVYVLPEGKALRFGYKLGVSFIVFALAILFPVLDFNFIIASAAIVVLWTIKVLTLRGAINEAAQSAYSLITMEEEQGG